jgi:hypothetical protein
MKKNINIKFIQLIFLLFNFILVRGIAQSVPQGVTYQGLARNSAGVVIASQPISIKVGIYSPTVHDVLEWEEMHTVSTNQLGLFNFIIGQGITTGVGTALSFSSINWGASSHFINIAMDETGGSSYVNVDTIQFWSVPYAMYSGFADSLSQPMRLNQLTDVDTLGVFTGAVLKWNGTLWMPSFDNDSDTALYSYNAGYSAFSDTAIYALNLLSAIDTVQFSYNADSSLYATNSLTAANSINSNYCDTALYALNTSNVFTYWNLNGNNGTTPTNNFLGTSDASDFVLKTNNSERMRITSSGRIGIGTASPVASLHVVGNDGLVAEGTFGSGVAPPSGAGTRMIWYPKKAAFRSGTVTSTQWDDVNIGNYSFASGYNTRASGAYSTVFGYNSIASGQYSLAACEQSTASGLSSVAMGSVAIASGPYSIALGRAPMATDSFTVAIGYHNTATAKYAISIGNQTDATGQNSIALGYYSGSNGYSGSFVFSDGTSTATAMTLNSANNQFMVRATGGIVFYSNSLLTSGVTLSSGGGSWASVSDRNRKQNFKKENPNEILNKLNSLEITSWNYKSQPTAIRHIGPMAQDIYELFRFGESDTTITTIDVDGLSLIAIQALSKKTEELKIKSIEIEKLYNLVAKLEKDKAILEKRIEKMEQKLNLVKPPSVLVVLKEEK